MSIHQRMNKEERRDVTRDYYHLNFRAIFHVTKQQQKNQNVKKDYRSFTCTEMKF